MRAFPINSEEDLERALALIEELWDAEPGTEAGDLLEVMSTLVDLYEAQRSTLPPADPLELIRFKLDELGWSQRELARQLGWGSGRVSEVLSGKRALTLSMVQKLSKVFDLPPGLLVHDLRDDRDHVDAARELAALRSQLQEVLDRLPSSSSSSRSGGMLSDAPPAAREDDEQPELRLVHGGLA